MKSLETGKLYVKDVFSEARFYRVPEYQRPYVWGLQQSTNFSMASVQRWTLTRSANTFWAA